MNLKKEEILVKIAIFTYNKRGGEFTLNELSKSININRCHPYLMEVFKLLLNNQIVVLIKEIGKTKFFTANKKKIRDFVDELPFTKIINEEYDSRYHIQPY